MDVVYPNVSSGAVRKEAFHHHLPSERQGGGDGRSQRETRQTRTGDKGEEEKKDD